ncbi:hypothetical protein RZS08_54695, partial [Arthrospira platensis SPKY1]|nr:hypothetical protein [Arthrospira platensis SPKY1]
IAYRFNFDTGVLTRIRPASNLEVYNKVTKLVNDWWKVEISIIPTSDDDADSINWGFINDDPTATSYPSYSGDPTKHFFIWGVQFEVGSRATSYIPTSGTVVTRQGDFIRRGNNIQNTDTQ